MAREYMKDRIVIEKPVIELTEEGLELSFFWCGKEVKLPVPHTELVHLHETLVAGELIRLGYLLFPVDGGWIVRSPAGEEHQIVDEKCTCGDYTFRREGKSRCKHLLFKDWFQRFRMLQMKASMEVNFGARKASPAPTPDDGTLGG